RELSLTYNLPAKFLDRSFFTDLSLSVVGRNLFFFYKEADNFDPESSYSTTNLGQGVLYYALPTTKSIGLSLNVKFKSCTDEKNSTYNRPFKPAYCGGLYKGF